MNWKTIRLELAATADFPKGSVGRGFLIRAPMKPDSRIDEQALLRTPDRAKVRRVWPNEPDEQGQLLRLDGHWALRFEGKPDRLIDLGASMQSGKQVMVSFDGNQSPFTVRIFD
jgi:hypothetical protein